MIKSEIIQKILDDYDTKVSLYSAFTVKQQQLISELLHERAISPHSVTSRVKTRQSLQDKLQRADAEYSTLEEVNDISGVRITTYFHDEVDMVADYLNHEFEIIQDPYGDKRKLLDADRFGYLSLHYIVKLSDDRLRFTENRRFPHLKCEIQIRSILQHAWAEIEHDLGYKTKVTLPQPVRRRFSRLAGLLELADEEFATIRDTLHTYKKNLPKEIKKRPEAVTLDKLSLGEFLASNTMVKELDSKIAGIFEAQITTSDVAIETDLQILNFFEIKTISDLEEALAKNSKNLLAFARLWIDTTELLIGRGICILYLGYVLAAKSRRVIHFLDTCGIGTEQEQLKEKIFDTQTKIENGQKCD